MVKVVTPKSLRVCFVGWVIAEIFPCSNFSVVFLLNYNNGFVFLPYISPVGALISCVPATATSSIHLFFGLPSFFLSPVVFGMLHRFVLLCFVESMLCRQQRTSPDMFKCTDRNFLRPSNDICFTFFTLA